MLQKSNCAYIYRNVAYEATSVLKNKNIFHTSVVKRLFSTIYKVHLLFMIPKFKKNKNNPLYSEFPSFPIIDSQVISPSFYSFFFYEISTAPSPRNRYVGMRTLFAIEDQIFLLESWRNVGGILHFQKSWKC